MQLKRILTLILLIFTIIENADAQHQTDLDKDLIDTVLTEDEFFEIDFVQNYYSQTGQNSAVTGGYGTEDLNNFNSGIILNIPVKNKSVIKINTGIDYYSAASNDNIDNPFIIEGYTTGASGQTFAPVEHVSGASSSDIRYHSKINYLFKKNYQNEFGGGLSVSNEFDVFSVGAELSYSFISENKNNRLDFSASYYYDDWKLIYPIELRNAQVEYYPTDKRNSYSISAVYSKIINKRIKLAINADYIYQNGLLSTPFHRVMFLGERLARVEQLPELRHKFPVSISINAFLFDNFILKTYYRYYFDNFEIKSHTARISMPIIINRWLRVYPSYRFYNQSEAYFFYPIWDANHAADYYTSDYDLSGFNSHTYSLGLSLKPVFGFARIKSFKKDKVFILDEIELKYSLYHRTNGLKAEIISLEFGFVQK